MRAMRALVLAFVLGACGGDDGEPVDIHAFADCDDAWMRNGYSDCENACVNSSVALLASGAACTAHTSNGAVSCGKTFEFEGVTGCCVSSAPRVLFGECD